MIAAVVRVVATKTSSYKSLQCKRTYTCDFTGGLERLRGSTVVVPQTHPKKKSEMVFALRLLSKPCLQPDLTQMPRGAPIPMLTPSYSEALEK